MSIAITRPFRYCCISSLANKGASIFAHNIFGKPDATDSSIKLPSRLLSKRKITTRSTLNAVRTSSTVVLYTSAWERDSQMLRVTFINICERSAWASCFQSKSGNCASSKPMFVSKATSSSLPATRSRGAASSRCNLFTILVEATAAFLTREQARFNTKAAIPPANTALTPVPSTSASSCLFSSLSVSCSPVAPTCFALLTC